jgi:hypothetical protein
LTLYTNFNVSGSCYLTINGKLNCDTNLVAGDGNFTLASGGTLGIGSIDGISATDTFGNIRVSGSRSFSKWGNYVYNGNSNQITGNGLPDTIGNLTVDKTDTLLLYTNCIINGTLSLTSGIFAPQSYCYIGITRPIAGNPSNFQPLPESELYILGTAEGIVLPAAADSLFWLFLDNPNGMTLSGELWINGNALYLRNGAIHPNGFNVHYNDNSGIDYCGIEPQTTSDDEFTTIDGPFFLSVENTNGVTLHADRYIPQYVDLLEGILYTGSHTLTIGPEATINESDGSHVAGRVSTTRVLTNNPESFGGLGLELEALGSAPDTTTVTRVTGSPIIQGNNKSIKRYFIINSKVNNDLDASMVFYYFDNELNDITEENLALFRSPDGSRWSMYGSGGTVDPGNNTVTATGIDSFSYWTSGDKNNPLAVELAGFSALAAEWAITLSWRTESENGSYQWIVERSDAESGPFVELGRVAAAGNSQVPRDYTWSDIAVREGKTYYYRIGELGLDGRIAYFGPVSCKLGRGRPQAALVLGCAPNPFWQMTTIRYQIAEPGKMSLKIYNISGQLVRRIEQGLLAPGYYQVRWDGADDNGTRLSAGVYLYRISIGGRQFGGKVQLVR